MEIIVIKKRPHQYIMHFSTFVTDEQWRDYLEDEFDKEYLERAKKNNTNKVLTIVDFLNEKK